MSNAIKVSELTVKAFRLSDDETLWRVVPFSRIREFRVEAAVKGQWEIQALLDDGIWEGFGQYPQRQEALNKAMDYVAAVWK